MRKTNRSQSSIRVCKTQEGVDKDSAWIGNMRPKQQQHDKENCALFQSVSQRQIDPVYDQSSVIGQDYMKRYFQDKCKKYEQELSQIYRELQKQGGKGGYNYSEKYYLKEIDDMRRQLGEKEEELQRYRQMYCSKSVLVEDMSGEMSLKLEREQKDKNLYIKEINNKNIQINKLQELASLFRSQKETLHLVLNEKQARINEFEAKVAQLDLRKKKIETYEAQIKDSQLLLKKIESQTQQLKQEADRKDQAIQDQASSISQLEQTNTYYSEKLKEFEEVLHRLSEERRSQEEAMQLLKKNCEDLKFCNRQLEEKNQIRQDLQTKLQASQMALEEAKRRNSELAGLNDKLKGSQLALEKSLGRSGEAEKENGVLKRELRDKEEKISLLQRNNKEQQTFMGRSKKEKEELLAKLQERSWECKTYACQADELRVENNNLREELGEYHDGNKRIEQRNEKIDTLIKENSRLTASLFDKINQVEKLQHKINSLESRSTVMANELSKSKAVLDVREQKIAESQLQIEDLRIRYETEISNRITAQQKALRSQQDSIAHKALATKVETEAEQLRSRIEDVREQHEGNLLECKKAMMELQEGRNTSLRLLEETAARIETMKAQLQDCRKQTSEATERELKHRETALKLECHMKVLLEQTKKLQFANGQLILKGKQIAQISQSMSAHSCEVVWGTEGKFAEDLLKSSLESLLQDSTHRKSSKGTTHSQIECFAESPPN